MIIIITMIIYYFYFYFYYYYYYYYYYNNNNNNNNNDDDDGDDNNRIYKVHFEICTFSSLRRELSPTRTLKWPGHNGVQITCNMSSACRVQRVVCHLVGRDSSAIKLDRVEIAFILVLFYWLNH